MPAVSIVLRVGLVVFRLRAIHSGWSSSDNSFIRNQRRRPCEHNPDVPASFVDDCGEFDTVLGWNKPKAGAAAHTAEVRVILQRFMNVWQPGELCTVDLERHVRL